MKKSVGKKNKAPSKTKFVEDDNQYSQFMRSLDNLDDGVDCADLDLRCKQAKLKKMVWTAGSESEDDADDDTIYEGGGKKRAGRHKETDDQHQQEIDQNQAAQKVKEIFSKQDILGKTHLKEVGEELRKGGSGQKTDFMEKEAEFVKCLKSVQNFHIEVCMTLMKVASFVLFCQFCFSVACIFIFQCLGDCPNGLICWVHYIKLFQSLYLMSSYYGNIKEKQPNHPIGQLNTFIVITLYYICLYKNMDQLTGPAFATDNNEIIHFCVVYPASDLLLILFSFFWISKVKKRSNLLIGNDKFTEYQQEAKIALADILYLPQEFESDDGEEDF